MRRNSRKSTTVLLALSGLALAASLSAQAQVKIGVITSATGPTAFVGIPQKNTTALLPAKIGDLTVEYLSYDDASDSTQSVQLTKKLLSEFSIDAMIGPSGSPNAMGVPDGPIMASIFDSDSSFFVSCTLWVESLASS